MVSDEAVAALAAVDAAAEALRERFDEAIEAGCSPMEVLSRLSAVLMPDGQLPPGVGPVAVQGSPFPFPTA